jgi:hypothetical protein
VGVDEAWGTIGGGENRCYGSLLYEHDGWRRGVGGCNQLAV